MRPLFPGVNIVLSGLKERGEILGGIELRTSIIASPPTLNLRGEISLRQVERWLDEENVMQMVCRVCFFEFIFNYCNFC